MRIGINARTLAYPSGGPKEYLLGLVRALQELHSGHELVLFYPDASHRGTFAAATELVLPCRNRLLFDWLALPAALRRTRCDVAFFPSSNMPPGIPCPAVVAMHDLGYFHPSLRMYRWADTFYMRRAIRQTVRHAAGLLSVSEFTRQDLLGLPGIRPERIAVTHEACDPMYKVRTSREAVDAFRRQHGLTRDCLLYAGNISPRKNLELLLDAIARAGDRLSWDLVVTGGLSWNEDFDARVRALGLAARVRRLGYVIREEMPLLYDAAGALVFPSLFEGFGLPVLEAQARGVPVVCANATALPEVAGQGALLVDPTSIPAWADALVRVCTDEALRQRLIRLGHANEARFTWRATAEKTMAVLEAVVAERQRG